MFEWNDKFSVANEEIDNQHKRLFQIGETIWKTLKSDRDEKYDEITLLLNELVDYTVYHFSSEERVMNSYNHSLDQNHIKEHNDFINKITDIRSLGVDKSQCDILFEILNFVADWITNHILETDVKDFKRKLLNI